MSRYITIVARESYLTATSQLGFHSGNVQDTRSMLPLTISGYKMAYKKQEIIDQCLEVLDNEIILFIEELVSFLPITKKTFYLWKLHECDDIKNALQQSKINAKAKLRRNWMASENATLNVALYKLIADDEEHRKLSASYVPSADADQKPLKYEVKISK